MSDEWSHFHISIHIDNSLKGYKDLSGFIKRDDGTYLTHAEVCSEFIRDRNKGHKFWCGCDNREEDGSCAGHKGKAPVKENQNEREG